MDRASESLVCATLHDLSNALSGVRGILDLSDPGRPLSAEERSRLDAILSEGFTTLQRARHLVLGSRPDGALESGPAWRAALLRQAEPLGVAFRCSIEVHHEGDPAQDRWPGELGRTWVLALMRQVLPFLGVGGGGRFSILTEADAREWRLSWGPVMGFPDSLQGQEDPYPRDVASHWIRQVGISLGSELRFEQGRVLARIPKF